jgi:hypothetical protein
MKVSQPAFDPGSLCARLVQADKIEQPEFEEIEPRHFASAGAALSTPMPANARPQRIGCSPASGCGPTWPKGIPRREDAL